MHATGPVQSQINPFRTLLPDLLQINLILSSRLRLSLWVSPYWTSNENIARISQHNLCVLHASPISITIWSSSWSVVKITNYECPGENIFIWFPPPRYRTVSMGMPHELSDCLEHLLQFVRHVRLSSEFNLISVSQNAMLLHMVDTHSNAMCGQEKRQNEIVCTLLITYFIHKW